MFLITEFLSAGFRADFLMRMEIVLPHLQLEVLGLQNDN